jgi:hypothetical protein
VNLRECKAEATTGPSQRGGAESPGSRCEWMTDL